MGLVSFSVGTKEAKTHNWVTVTQSLCLDINSQNLWMVVFTHEEEETLGGLVAYMSEHSW